MVLILFRQPTNNALFSTLLKIIITLLDGGWLATGNSSGFHQTVILAH